MQPLILVKEGVEEDPLSPEVWADNEQFLEWADDRMAPKISRAAQVVLSIPGAIPLFALGSVDRKNGLRNFLKLNKEERNGRTKFTVFDRSGRVESPKTVS